MNLQEPLDLEGRGDTGWFQRLLDEIVNDRTYQPPNMVPPSFVGTFVLDEEE